MVQQYVLYALQTLTALFPSPALCQSYGFQRMRITSAPFGETVYIDR